MTDTTTTDMLPATTASSKPERLPITVEKPTPYTYDLGHLTATDSNPLPATSTLLTQPTVQRNQMLQAIARDGAQTLLNTLLSTCPITSTPDGLIMTLPHSENQSQLPRWKPLPKPKAPTKWENFARKKGIGKFGGNLKGGAALEERKKNLVYDEEKGEWVKKWGYKGKNKNEESDWLVELDEKRQNREKEAAEEGSGKTVRAEGRRERVEKMRRQERKERGNDRRARKGGAK